MRSRPPCTVRWMLLLSCVIAGAAAAQCPPEQMDKLTASNADTFDRFGIAVQIRGDLAIVGAYLDEGDGANSGSAYIFARQPDGTWIEQDVLTPNDGAGGDWFGVSVDVDGERALVGAQFHDAQGSNSGAAYVFEQEPDRSWMQVAKLVPADSATSDWCGHSVALDGDTAVISAQLDDDAGADAGAAYVFARNNDGSWSEQDKLIASDGAAGDEFGTNVAIHGDLIVVGARWADLTGVGSDAGAAWVFHRDGDNWSEEAKLTASDATANDEFGFAVSVDTDTIVVGARLEDEAGTNAGAAYVYASDGQDNWTETAKLFGADTAPDDRFGESVSIDNQRIVIGARQHDAAGADAGAAHVFQESPAGWDEVAKLQSDDLAPMDFFGIYVAIDGPHVIVGANLDDDDGDQSGSAYVFNLDTAGDPPADFDCSGAVDVTDLLQLLGAWGPCPGCLEDLNGDGIVNVSDLLQLLSRWG